MAPTAAIDSVDALASPEAAGNGGGPPRCDQKAAVSAPGGVCD